MALKADCYSIKSCFSSKVVHHPWFPSRQVCLPSKVVFIKRLSFIKRVSSIQCCFLLKVLFHVLIKVVFYWKKSSLKSFIPFHQSLYWIKCQREVKKMLCPEYFLARRLRNYQSKALWVQTYWIIVYLHTYIFFNFYKHVCIIALLHSCILTSEVQKIFFFLSSRYNCAIFSAAFKKF